MSDPIGVAIWLFWRIWPLDGIIVYKDTLIKSIISPTSGLYNSSEVQPLVYIMYDNTGHACTSLRDVLFVSVTESESPQEDFAILLIKFGCISEPVRFGPRFGSVEIFSVHISLQMDLSTELHLISVCAFRRSLYGGGSYFFS